jgi:hypothetical protein
VGISKIEHAIKNPFFASEILEYFAYGFGGSFDYKILLIVLPMIYQKDIFERLKSCKSDSSIYTIFSSPKEYFNKEIVLNTKIDFSNFSINYNFFLPLSKQAIIILASSGKISINNDIVIINQKNDYKKIKKCKKRDYYRAAYYLGFLLSKNSIYEFLELLKGVSNE